MASNAQIAANRANARKSTGPRTTPGKTRSRHNSRKHGLTAKTLIIVGERPDDFKQLRAALMVEFDPHSAMGSELVGRVAEILYRLRRVPVFEAAIMATLHHEADKWNMEIGYSASAQTECERSLHSGYALINDAKSNDALGKLGRHEAMLMNSLTKTLRLLQQYCGGPKDEPVTIESVALPDTT